MARTKREFFEVTLCRFACKNLNIKAHGAVIIRRYQDFINKFIHKLLGNGACGGGLLHTAHGGLHGINLILEFLPGILLLFQLLNLGLCVGNLIDTLFVHGDEVVI